MLKLFLVLIQLILHHHQMFEAQEYLEMLIVFFPINLLFFQFFLIHHRNVA